ncbi:MAG TPA: hypothetical protein PKD37_04575 [Oligoflexia bacterium]|nr:hypothetical protein [Oligoflexia bacterium]HMP27239.1 hypothetical protein [Oligoflexia bacterium]
MKEEQEKKVLALAEIIKAKGMQTPVSLFLEAHLPLAGILSHSLLVFDPLISGLFRNLNLKDLQEMLSSRELLEKLLRELET